MEAYTAFADIYNEFMDNIPYDEWSENIVGIFRKYGVADGTIADLGCGTGNMTRRLAASGYNMIGVDMSEDMLVNARVEEENNDILYLLQDMRELELGGNVRGVVSVCDSMNYILSTEDLMKVFLRIKKYLDDDGVFIFDMKTKYFYEKVLGDSIITDNREDAALIWENEYDPEASINNYYLTIFVPVSDDEDPLFERYQEQHTQKAYRIEEVCSVIEQSGLRLIDILDADTMNTVNDTLGEQVERLYYVIMK